MTTNSRSQNTTPSSRLHMSLELSAAKWKLGFSDQLGRKPRVRSMPAGQFDQLQEEIARAKQTFGLAPETPVVSCYEAGRDGFWIHRCLVSMGIESHIVEPASIEVNRRKRRAKTDRIDGEKIVVALMRFKAGDRFACRMIRVPDVDVEDARNLNREMRTIKKERTAHSNRIKSLLVAQGISGVVIDASFPTRLQRMRTPQGQRLGAQFEDRLLREFDRLALATEQIRLLQMQQAETLRAAAKEVRKSGANVAVIAEHLVRLVGIGPVSAWTLSAEIFSWRDIENRRKLAALVGLTPTPHSSGN